MTERWNNRNYRGRSNRGKVALAIVLSAIIVLSVVWIVLQNHTYYDADGRRHVRFDGKKETVEEEILEPELIIEEAPPRASHASAIEERPITMETPLSEGALVWLKDETGRLYFPTADALGATATGGYTVGALERAAEAKCVGRICCFPDASAAAEHAESMGLKNTDGLLFSDAEGRQWLDPAKSEARAYLTALICDAASFGFEEIVLIGVSYPTEGALEAIDYGTEDRAGMLGAFLQEVRAALGEGVTLSIELPEETILAGRNEASGQTLAVLAPLVDRVYAVTEREEEASAAVRAVSERTEFVVIDP